MAPKTEYIIHEGDISRRNVSANGVAQIEDRALRSFTGQLTNRVPLDTGIIPEGLVLIRQAGIHQRLVVVMPPDAQTLIWGQNEGDPNAKRYLVAQPYRIFIGDYVNGNWHGGRQFYSPYPVTDLNARLYHANVPNLNCRGYGGTAVGWVCLYQRDDTTKYSLAQRVAYLGLRMSGNEAYNNANMSQTDGPRFYESMGKPKHVCDPLAWESYTEKHGVNWTLDADLWIPVLVAGPDSQLQHDPKGKQLTLGGAISGIAPMYYGDSGIRLFNSREPSVEQTMNEIYAPAYAASRVTHAGREVPVEAQDLKKVVPESKVPGASVVGATFRKQEF